MSTLLNFSEATALALHAAVLLAHQEGKVLSVKDIARPFQASEAHLVKVCQRLARAGHFEARRGPLGGFRLHGDPGRTTLLDIYEAIEGPVETAPCRLRNHGCLDAEDAARNGECVIGARLRDLEEEVLRYLRDTTLAAVAAECPLEVPA